MPTIPTWKNPFNKKVLIHDHTKQRQQNDECRNVDAALLNQLLTAFEDTYLSPLKNAFTGYFGSTTLRLLSHLYDNYARILAMELAKNDKKQSEPCNLNEPEPLNKAK